MELDVFHFDGLSSRRAAGRFEHDLVVETQAQFRHTTQVALHLDSSEDFTSEHVSVGTDEQVQAFDNVKEDFVLAVADAF